MSSEQEFFLNPTKHHVRPKKSLQIESNRERVIYDLGVFHEWPMEDLSLLDLVSQAFSNFRDRPCCGIRAHKDGGALGDYTWITYSDVEKDVKAFGMGLIHIGLIPSRDLLGIYAPNSPEWLITTLAACSQSIPIVPLYNASGPDPLKNIVSQTRLSTVVCAAAQIPALLESCSSVQCLKTIIALDSIEESHKTAAKAAKVKLIPYSEVLSLGRDNLHPNTPPTPESLYMIMFTSGEPKGVQLTHRNIAVSVSTTIRVFGVLPSDIHLSYLPLAHIFEHIAALSCLASGAAIGFSSSARFTDDIKKLKPTLLIGVPLVFNRLYSKLQQSINKSSFIRRLMFNYGFAVKKKMRQTGGDTPYWNKYVFNKITSSFGLSRVRLIISAAAPLAPDVMSFLRVCFGPVVQVYGMTEAAGPITCTDPNQEESEWTHGKPVSTVELKIVDVPEMGYYANADPPTGEICVRGPSIFRGYFNDPAQTAQSFDSDGFFHTGDIAKRNPDGSISLIDRKKNIFKLAQGEYIAAEYLENVYGRSKFVNQIFIYGDSLKSFLVAIVVPNEAQVFAWAKEANIDATDIATLCRHPAVKRRVFDDLMHCSQLKKLQSFEVIRNIHLESEPWTVENGCLLATNRLNRVQLRKKYSALIDKLYEQPTMISDGKSKL